MAGTKITFCGAAGEVTGSCYRVDAEGACFLVDCGMFQGGREADLKNREFRYFNPAAIDFVLLTHAHIDHSGLLPRLVAQGYAGPIYTTQATIDLLEVMLRDSAYIQQKEAEWETRHPERANSHTETILYSLEDVENTLALLKPVGYGSQFLPAPGISCRFLDAGHILGSAIIEVWACGKKIVFSGDLGQPGRPILRSPALIEDSDILLIESTYGNRLHKSLEDTLDEFVHAINDTLHRKHGNIIIPAFTVGRTQEILYLLIDLARQKRLKNLRIYVDSPMALSATEITMKHTDLLNRDAQDLVSWGMANRSQMPDIRFIQNVEESIALNDVHSGAIIISASGMCDAGRIKHHLRHNIRRPECSIVFTGFQAEGTLGRRIVNGADMVRIFGEDIPVRSDIYTIGGLSAHADQAALLEWLEHFKCAPRQTFVVHGESATAAGFAELVNSRLGWAARMPALGETVEL